MERSRGNAALFWPVLAAIVVSDYVTKRMAVDALVPQRMPHEVLGDAVRLTLVYNPGAAFGLHLGPYSRWIFTALTAAALVILWRLFRATRPGDTVRTLALALVCGGAIGNLIDRAHQGHVTDFLKLPKWPAFNVADVAITVGVIALLLVIEMNDRRDRAARPA